MNVLAQMWTLWYQDSNFKLRLECVFFLKMKFVYDIILIHIPWVLALTQSKSNLNKTLWFPLLYNFYSFSLFHDIYAYKYYMIYLSEGEHQVLLFFKQ